MKGLLTKLFWPVLGLFEDGNNASNYKSSYRVILNVVGSLFILLSAVGAWAAMMSDQLGAFIPVVVFCGVGLVALLVGSLGSNSAVCKIWGSK
jgi:hypothetical protein